MNINFVVKYVQSSCIDKEALEGTDISSKFQLGIQYSISITQLNIDFYIYVNQEASRVTDLSCSYA